MGGKANRMEDARMMLLIAFLVMIFIAPFIVRVVAYNPDREERDNNGWTKSKAGIWKS